MDEPPKVARGTQQRRPGRYWQRLSAAHRVEAARVKDDVTHCRDLQAAHTHEYMQLPNTFQPGLGTTASQSRQRQMHRQFSCRMGYAFQRGGGKTLQRCMSVSLCLCLLLLLTIAVPTLTNL